MIKPMLAFPIEDKLKYVKFPCLVSPKLDGIRCIAEITKDTVNLYSRNGKPFTALPFIEQQLRYMYDQLGLTEILILDGELYNHDFKNNFSEIVSMVKRKVVHPKAEKFVEYHIFDVVDDGNWITRTLKLYTLSNDPFPVLIPITDETKNIKFLDNIKCADQEQLDNFEKIFIAEGYEGAMYRDIEAEYEQKRSPTLLKIKRFKEDEFEIVGGIEGEGKLVGKLGAFTCKTKEGKEFGVKMSGKEENLVEYLLNLEQYIGKMVTVRYFNLTPDEKVPRFPVGVSVRDYE
jgi:DNA ligase-1